MSCSISQILQWIREDKHGQSKLRIVSVFKRNFNAFYLMNVEKKSRKV